MCCNLFSWPRHSLPFLAFSREGFTIGMNKFANRCSASDYGHVSPEKFAIGSAAQSHDLHIWTTETIKLSPNSPILTLDYGIEVAGFPFLDVRSLSGPAQLEVKYAEQYPAILENMADGPLTFSNGLSNTFRIETFNVTGTGYVESFFIQGGQRWQTVRLLTNKSVELQGLGFRATSQHTLAKELPGRLKTGVNAYDRIFGLGGRAVQVACVDSGNAPTTWEITGDGALVRGQAAAQSILGQEQANYTMSFDTKIVRGGTGWRVATSVQPYGPYFVLTSNYSDGSTFVNINRTLLPANKLIFNYGWSLVNQSTLITGWNEYYPLNVSVAEGKWYTISTTIEEEGYRIRLDGEQIAFIPIFQAAFLSGSAATYFGTGSPFQGSWGFGGFQDQVAYVRDVSVLRNGTEIYRNSMITQDTLGEYNIASLDHSVCLDGGKRDRLVWIGDFYHSVRVIAHSTVRWDYVLGTIDYVFSYQVDSGAYTGFVPISVSLGARPENKEAYKSTYAGLVDYQDLFLASIGSYFRYTGDGDGLRPHWERIKKLAAAKMAFLDPYSGLVGKGPNMSTASNFLGPVNGSATTGLLAYALQQLGPLAEYFNDTSAFETYASTSSQLREALNERLWNSELGTYAVSTDSPGNFSMAGIAWAILCGAANATQVSLMIPKLEELRFGVGYRSVTSDAETSDYELSPNFSGFLLEALLKSHRDFGTQSTTAIEHLLKDLWGSMVNNDEYSSGASWEYVHPDGSPGIDLYTSLAHPWGAAPTYVLPEYLIGVQPSSPGYKNITVTPMVGYLGLPAVNATIPTPYGGVDVFWEAKDKDWLLIVQIPKGVQAELKFPVHIVSHVNGTPYGNEAVRFGKRSRIETRLRLWP